MTKSKPIPQLTASRAAEIKLSSLAEGESISSTLIEKAGASAEDVIASLTRRSGRRFEIVDGIITRVHAYDVRGKYNFTDMKPGESREVDAPVTAWPAARGGVRRSAAATGWRYRTSIRSGTLVVTRVDGTSEDTRAKLPFESTPIGASFDVASGPDVKVRNIRVQALYYGRKLGCRFTVKENGLGGCTITREAVSPVPEQPANEPPRIRVLPPAPEPSFDTEEF